MYKETYKIKKIGPWKVKIEIVDLCEGCPWFTELYASSEHIGGTTIQVPSYLQHRHSPKHYVGQYTPRQLAKDYAKQGRKNPSKEAYESLQKELEHYILASDCTLKATVYKIFRTGKHRRFVQRIPGVSYDSYEQAAKLFIKNYGLDFVKEAIKEAREMLKQLIAA